MVQALLDHGADVDAKDANGQTPLHWALRPSTKRIWPDGYPDPWQSPLIQGKESRRAEGEGETVRLLLDHGAKIRVVDDYDCWAEDYADVGTPAHNMLLDCVKLETVTSVPKHMRRSFWKLRHWCEFQ